MNLSLIRETAWYEDATTWRLLPPDRAEIYDFDERSDIFLGQPTGINKAAAKAQEASSSL